MANPVTVERKIIYASKKRRPYGVKLKFLLQEHYDFQLDGACNLLVTKGLILEVIPENDNPHLKGYCIKVTVDGFATAGEAEQAGLKVALGLLWSAVSKQYSARLLYNTPLPCSVYDRNTSQGLVARGYATVSMSYGLEALTDPLDEILESELPVDPKLLIAVEIFASAKLETTERAKFVGLVSSLEPLSTQEKYEIEELNCLIRSFKNEIENSGLDLSLKKSLKGRIEQLKIESVSRSIKRMVKEKLPDDNNSLELIEDAYKLRSKILHEGATDADLEQKTREVENIIKTLIQLNVEECIKNT